MIEVKGGFSRFGLIGRDGVDTEISFEAVTVMDLRIVRCYNTNCGSTKTRQKSRVTKKSDA